MISMTPENLWNIWAGDIKQVRSSSICSCMRSLSYTSILCTSITGEFSWRGFYPSNLKKHPRLLLNYNNDPNQVCCRVLRLNQRRRDVWWNPHNSTPAPDPPDFNFIFIKTHTTSSDTTFLINSWTSQNTTNTTWEWNQGGGAGFHANEVII